MTDKLEYFPDEKLIVCKDSVTSLDVKIDVYSRTKEAWMVTGSLNKFIFPISPVGGNAIDEVGGVYITNYYFLKTGWRIRPYEGSHTLTVGGGVILTLEGVDPFIPTTGSYNVQVKYSQPIRTETVILSASGSGGLTPEQDAKLTSIYNKTDNLPSDPASDTSIAFAFSASLQFREGNVRRTLVKAEEDDIIRNVASGSLDHIIIDVKNDNDADWTSPISTKTLYCWYENLGDVNPVKVGEND